MGRGSSKAGNSSGTFKASNQFDYNKLSESARITYDAVAEEYKPAAARALTTQVMLTTGEMTEDTRLEIQRGGHSNKAIDKAVREGKISKKMGNYIKNSKVNR